MGENTVDKAETGAVGEWEEREAAQASAYDMIGERYDEAFPHKAGQIEFVDRLLHRLPPGARVLDLGCGTGLPTSRQLVDAGCRVTGTDISPVMLDLARRNVPEARIIQADMLDLDPEAARYDAVVAYFSLLHLPRARIPETLRLIHGALAPGGRLCLSMVEADVDDITIPFLGSPVRVTGYLRDDLRAVLTTAGFRVEDEEAFPYAPATTQAQPEIQLFLICERAD